jgi:hypothetical protein
LPKVPIKTYEINAQAEVASRNPAIPRVVLAHRNESHRTEGRRRSRGFLRRRELVVADDENYGLEDEPIQPATRPDESSIVDQAPEQKRTVRVCRKIREIDAQYGTTPNNPRVAEVMAQLGTHYDSIERALETVLSLQLEELLEEQRGQAEELSRHNDWLKGELHSPEIVKRQKARSSDEGLSGDVCPQRRR